MDHSDLVKEHFDIKYQDYDNLIRNLIPKYEEMHSITINALEFPLENNLKFLDLGIGTGQTALALLNKYKKSFIHGVDISENMLDQARLRLAGFEERLLFENKNMADFEPNNIYDACIAILSIHHLNKVQKQDLFKKVYNSLRKKGVFSIGDIMKFDTEEETKEKEEEWKEFLIGNLGEEKGNFWFENYLEEDIPSSTTNQTKWLKSAGFETVQCVWKHINYAVIVAKK